MTPGVADTYIINLSANLEYSPVNTNYVTLPGALLPYVRGGFGYYIIGTGGNNFGLNLGAGAIYNLNLNINFELGVDYNIVFMTDTQFLRINAGVNFLF